MLVTVGLIGTGIHIFMVRTMQYIGILIGTVRGMLAGTILGMHRIIITIGDILGLIGRIAHPTINEKLLHIVILL